MRAVTRAILSEGTERAWGECFGPPVAVVALPAETEAQRLFACAVVLADDFRHLREFGLADASAEDRFLAAWSWCRVLRDVEAGRIGRVGQPAGAR
jgi:hypothetical protein